MNLQTYTDLAYQGGFRRLLAAFIDGILRFIVPFIVLIPLLMLAGLIESVDIQNALILLMILVYIFVFIAFWFINRVLLPRYNAGQTIGKKICGIKIITIDNKDLSLSKLFFREFFLELFSFFFSVFPLLIILFTEKKQGIHDMVVNTVVVRTNSQ